MASGFDRSQPMKVPTQILNRVGLSFSSSQITSPLKHLGTARMSSSKESYLELVKQNISFLKTRFYFKRGEISVIHSPQEFYETLKRKILQAEDRIFIASLYIGKTQDELLDCIAEALKKNSKLKVYFLIDGLRGTREAPFKCSASLLAQLLKEYSNRVDIRLYRTPAFVGWKGSVVPKRINEGLGLQHMKIYGFDDEVLLSGANLSTDYFTNRQDRYYLFNSKPFSSYYFRLHQLISYLSYKVKYTNSAQNFLISWPASNLAIEPKHSKKRFIQEASAVLDKFLNMEEDERSPHKSHANDIEYPTVVYPISQFTPLFGKGHDKSTEKRSILALISSISDPSITWTFTAGYFNMLPEIRKALVSTPSRNATVITASPYANGFYESKGVSGHLPDAYLHLSKKFLQNVKQHGKEAKIVLREWKRGIVNKPGGWSYHAKGLWISAMDGKECLPMATCIGSSNYTRRAYSLDLESNAIIITKDKELRHKMQKELENLTQHTKVVTLDDFKNDPARRVSTGIKIATTFLGTKL